MAVENPAKSADDVAGDARDLRDGNGPQASAGSAQASGAAQAAQHGSQHARPSAGSSGLGMVRDIAVTLSIEVGRVRMTIAQLMELGEGSVVELERLAEEPLDVFVNGTRVARGEAVVVGERFGIRLTEVVGDPRAAGS